MRFAARVPGVAGRATGLVANAEVRKSRTIDALLIKGARLLLGGDLLGADVVRWDVWQYEGYQIVAGDLFETACGLLVGQKTALELLGGLQLVERLALDLAVFSLALVDGRLRIFSQFAGVLQTLKWSFADQVIAGIELLIDERRQIGVGFLYFVGRLIVEWLFDFAEYPVLRRLALIRIVYWLGI